ncbi:RNA methylase [Natrialba chahannaoensis JCM 10990]|uniref:tRNA (guanine(10)-N(2))-dimethyltransferase n=1 Tax=Natrialba chahannaoensis JCM 10990 TaxID=1227492 RepID=M0AWI8_9EURY|nr:RNA methylase [Natrialba chahannaoensis]ELZ02890.1 RNA methylase [Natrialba chahannaoensis JCM 10990]
MYFLELGGEDDAFAAREAASAASDVRRIAPGLAVARGIKPKRVRGLAYTHRASELLGRTGTDLASARALLEAAVLERDPSETTVAVRATDVHGATGIDTAQTERELGQVLVDRGFGVDLDDPDRVLRAVFSAGSTATDEATTTQSEGVGRSEDNNGDTNTDTGDGVCALGWLAAESIRDFGTRAPTDKPFFQPGSMDPLLARAVANIAGARLGRTLLDPMCGTGGVLVEAGLVGADVIGTDAQAKMVEGAQKNLSHFLDRDEPSPTGVERGVWHVGRGDGTRLPLADDAVDGVVFDAPYGRQSKIDTHRLEDLVAGALSEARRVASRAVVIADRSWEREASEAGWELESTFERRVHRSLTRYVLILSDDSK